MRHANGRIVRCASLTVAKVSPRFRGVQNTTSIAKVLIGILVLGAQLCPCPSFAVDTTDDSAHHAVQDEHGHHANGSEQSTTDTMADCHGDQTRSDCTMSADSSTSAPFGGQDRYDHVMATAVESAQLTAFPALPPLAVCPPAPQILPAETPVSRLERMLT